MKKEKSNFTNEDELVVVEVSLDELLKDNAYRKSLDERTYDEYLSLGYTPKKANSMCIDYKCLEDIFPDELSYVAMKELPLSEKFAIYVCVFKKEYLDRLCKDYQISKQGFIQMYNNGRNRFKHYRKKYARKGYKVKPRKNYHKKGGGSNV